MMSDVVREPERDTDVLVIGAGIAGIVAATELTRAGARVLVLDKGRSVGGRLASRRIGEATFDHGAQFITARTPWFSGVIERCRDAGVVKEWCRGFAEPADRHVRWRGHPTINAVAKYLARGLKSMQVDGQPCLIVSHDPPLVIAGDGFAGPRVEGAALSGLAAAEAIMTGAS